MSIENQNSQEQNQEFDAGVKAKESISQENTKKLAEELDKELNTPSDILNQKFIWRGEEIAGKTDKKIGSNVENNATGIKSKQEAINALLQIPSIKSLDWSKIQTLSPKDATAVIQAGMYLEFARKNPGINNKLVEKFKELGKLPNGDSIQKDTKDIIDELLKNNSIPAAEVKKMLEAAGLEGDVFKLFDGKFGARSALLLDLIVKIPPPEEKPTEKPNEKIEEKIMTYEPKYTINVRGDAADGAYFFVDTEEQYQNFITQYPTIFSSALIKTQSNAQEKEHLGVTINSTKNGFEENIKDYAKRNDVLGPFKRISDTQEKQKVLRSAGKLRKDDFGNMVADKVDNRHIFKNEKNKQYTIVRAQ